MATNYGERIARVEENQKATNATLKEVKDDVKTILGKFDDLEDIFVTRKEVALVKAAIGLIATVLGIYISIKGL
jgi:uncharacterized protein (UPF0335 family)